MQHNRQIRNVLLGEQKGETTMRWPIDGKVAGAFSVALFSVGLLGVLAYTSMTKFMKSNRWAAHAQEALAELDDVPPGTYEVRVSMTVGQPGRSWTATTSAEPSRVDVPDQERLEMDVRVPKIKGL